MSYDLAVYIGECKRLGGFLVKRSVGSRPTYLSIGRRIYFNSSFLIGGLSNIGMSFIITLNLFLAMIFCRLLTKVKATGITKTQGQGSLQVDSNIKPLWNLDYRLMLEVENVPMVLCTIMQICNAIYIPQCVIYKHNTIEASASSCQRPQI